MFLYIDATAGGILIQVLLGGFAGIGFLGRLFWSRFSPGSSEQPIDPEAEAADSSEPESIDRAA